MQCLEKQTSKHVGKKITINVSKQQHETHLLCSSAF